MLKRWDLICRWLLKLLLLKQIVKICKFKFYFPNFRMTVEERAVQRQIRRDEAFALKMMEVNIFSFVCYESRLPVLNLFTKFYLFIY
jgi:hypothetical protein